MDKDIEKEKEDTEENHESVRIETAELVNGDMGSSEQSDDHSPSHADRTGTETENEEIEAKTEGEHRNEEGSTDHKVRIEFKHLLCAPGTQVLCISTCYVIQLELPCCTDSSLIDKLSAFIYFLSFQYD